MFYFDCLCQIGPINQKDPAAPWSAGDVLGWMDRCGIAAAAVVHTLSIEDEPIRSRDRLAEEVAGATDRLFPVWTMLPPGAGDFEETPEAFLDAMESRNVRAVKLFPLAHAYPLVDAVVGPMLRALQDRRVLTMIDIDQISTDLTAAFEILDPLLGRYPRLPVLLQRHNWAMQRLVLALMQRHENLHIEFSSYQINRGIERYVERFGPERLLFGTGLPAMNPGAARAFIDYAQVSPDAKEKIAGGNLLRLLGGVVPAQAPPRPPDPLRDRAAAGQPLTDSLVLDAHCHVLNQGARSAGRVVMYDGDADGLVQLKDLMGVRRTAIMSWSGPAASDAVGGNRVVSQALAKYPDRFLGMVYINPAHLTEQELIREVRTRIEEDGFIGLKPYPRVGLRYNDPLYRPAWQYADDRRLYVLLHLMPNTAGGVEVVDDLARQYPNAQWAVAHTGGQWRLGRDVVGVMRERPNVWAELTYTTVVNGLIEWMVAQVGDERILFGTDAPMRDPRPQLGWVVWADLPLQSRRKILGENFARLLSMGESGNAP